MADRDGEAKAPDGRRAETAIASLLRSAIQAGDTSTLARLLAENPGAAETLDGRGRDVLIRVVTESPDIEAVRTGTEIVLAAGGAFQHTIFEQVMTAASPDELWGVPDGTSDGEAPFDEASLSEVVAARLAQVRWLFDSVGHNALHYAAAFDRPDFVASLCVRRACGLEDRAWNRATPLLVAALVGAVRAGQVLLRHGADPLATRRTRENALHTASARAHLPFVEMLLAEGACDPDVRSRVSDFQAIHFAAQAGAADIVRYLAADAGVDVNTKARGRTPLMLAASLGRLAVVEALVVDLGASLEEVNDDNNTALILAARESQSEVVRLLLGHGAVPTGRALVAALRHGTAGDVTALVQHGADVSFVSGENEETPLILAVHTRRIELVRLLLDCGVGVDTPDLRGETALMAACALGSQEMVDVLLSAGADPHARATNGMTTLMCAAQSGCLGLVKLLVEEEEVSVNAADNRGENATIYAIVASHETVVRWLMQEAGALLLRDQAAASLVRCCQRGALGVVKLLVEEFDVDPDATPADDGLTGLLRAVRSENMEMVHYLVDHGADINATWESESVLTMAATLRADLAYDFSAVCLQRGADANSTWEGCASALQRAVKRVHRRNATGQMPSVVRLLLQHGANPNNVTRFGTSVLRSAALHETRALLVEAGARDASAEIDPEELLAIASNRPPVFAALVDGDVARVHAIVDANPAILHVPYEGLYAALYALWAPPPMGFYVALRLADYDLGVAAMVGDRYAACFPSGSAVHLNAVRVGVACREIAEALGPLFGAILPMIVKGDTAALPIEVMLMVAQATASECVRRVSAPHDGKQVGGADGSDGDGDGDGSGGGGGGALEATADGHRRLAANMRALDEAGVFWKLASVALDDFLSMVRGDIDRLDTISRASRLRNSVGLLTWPAADPEGMLEAMT